MLNMKKVGILFVILLLLTACGSTAVEPDTGGSSADTTQVYNTEETKMKLNTDYSEDSLSVVLQLLVGSLSMENSEQPIDSNMAESLLPYWKMYKALAESETAAPEEMESIIGQIQEIMSTEQLEYIAGLELDQEAMVVLMNELAIFENLSGGMGGTGTGVDRPEGAVPGTGGGPGGGTGPGSVDPELMATKQAERASSSGGGRLTLPLVEALINLLEGKIES